MMLNRCRDGSNERPEGACRGARLIQAVAPSAAPRPRPCIAHRGVAGVRCTAGFDPANVGSGLCASSRETHVCPLIAAAESLGSEAYAFFARQRYTNLVDKIHH